MAPGSTPPRGQLSVDGAIDVVRAALRHWDLPQVAIDTMTPGANGEAFLLDAGRRRWVAKLAHAPREQVQPGLAVSERLADGPFAVATPVRSTRGELVEMVEWPPGENNPLAILDFVGGEPLSHFGDDAPEVEGQVCGVLADRLGMIDPTDVGLDPSTPFIPGQRRDNWDLGRYGWLNDVSDHLADRVHQALPQLPHSVAVWDGPEVLIHDGRIGLVDFGMTDWMPRVHPIARGTVLTAYNDRDRLDRFISTVNQHIDLSEPELDALELLRLVSATVYARSCAAQTTQHRLPRDHYLVAWLHQLLAVIHTDHQLTALAR